MIYAIARGLRHRGLLMGLATPAVACWLDRGRDLSRPWPVAAGAAIAVQAFTIYDRLGRWLYLSMLGWSILTVAALVVVPALAHLRSRSLA